MGEGATRSSGLSRERILETARRIVDAGGLPALSMRRLAQELDVWPMSIYRYFENKEELLDAMAATAAEGIVLPSRRAGWRAQLRSLLRGAHASIAGDPGAMGGRLPSAFLSPGALRVSEAGMRVLVTAGLDAEEAADAWRALLSYTLGSATFRLGVAPDEAVRRTRSAIAALPDDEYPTLLATADELAASFAAQDAFEYGLERMLDGLAGRVRSAASAAVASR
jgi:TetR/AcrR family tetracycline transcriptional repressor